MPRRGFYAVLQGECPGIYRTWDECKAQVIGFPAARYYKFNTLGEAEACLASQNTQEKGSQKAVGPGTWGRAPPRTCSACFNGVPVQAHRANAPKAQLGTTPASLPTVKLRAPLSYGAGGILGGLGLGPAPKLAIGKSVASSYAGAAECGGDVDQRVEEWVANMDSASSADGRLGTGRTGANRTVSVRPSRTATEVGEGEGESKIDPIHFTWDRDGWELVYCDGACKNGAAGVGVWWGPGNPRNLAERCPGTQTNNCAELVAIARVLETAPKSNLLIRTDSQYSIGCLTNWLPFWQSNDYTTSTPPQLLSDIRLPSAPIKNASLIRYISALIDGRKNDGQMVQFGYVRGHSGERGNDGADSLAALGMERDAVEERDWERLEREVRHEMRTRGTY